MSHRSPEMTTKPTAVIQPSKTSIPVQIGRLSLIAAALLALSACQSMPVPSSTGSAASGQVSPLPTVAATDTDSLPSTNTQPSRVELSGDSHTNQNHNHGSRQKIIQQTYHADGSVTTTTSTTTSPTANAASKQNEYHSNQQNPFASGSSNNDASDYANDNSASHASEHVDSVTVAPNYPTSQPAYSQPPVVPPINPSTPSTVIIPQQPAQSAREALLERARQTSQPGFDTTPTVTADGDDLPAFRRLMQSGITALQANRLTEAETSFTRAQRLAPKSSAVYFYLAQVALKKNQPRKAEAMARRGLIVTQDNTRRRALWQLILKSGQMQNNSRVINEATQALRRL